ncbi:MAG TPA: ABC transporter permease [Micromonosporaceae bacterium]
MRAALRIAAKDLRQRVRDRSAFLLAVVLPLAMAFIYGSLFGPSAEPRAFEYGVVDLDRGPIAGAFVADVLEPLAADGVIRIRDVATADEAERLADRGSIDAAFVLPAGFSAASLGAAPARIQVLGDIDAPIGTEVARSIAGAFLAELTSVRVAVAAVAHHGDGRPVDRDRLAQLAERARNIATPVVLQNVTASTKVLGLKAYFAAGMAIFFLFFTVQFGVASLLEERSNGTLGRLLAAPIPAGAVLAGKLLASLALGVASMAVLVTAAAALMGIRWGDPVGLALLVLSAVLAATGVAALVASVARTQEQAGSWNSVIAVTLAMLGGVMFQTSQLGGVVAAIGLATPHAWFLRGLGELAAGGGARAVLPAVAAMLGFAVVAGGIAVVRLRKAVAP